MRRTLAKMTIGAMITVGLALALVGCQAFKDVPPAEGLRLACEGFTSELTILAPLRADGTLSATAVKIVQTQKDAVDPICAGEAPDLDDSTKKVAVDAGVKVLTSLATTFVKQSP